MTEQGDGGSGGHGEAPASAGDIGGPPSRMDLRKGEDRCPQCGYSLQGLRCERCPECGIDLASGLAEAARRKKAREKHSRQCIIAGLLLLLGLGGITLLTVFDAMTLDWPWGWYVLAFWFGYFVVTAVAGMLAYALLVLIQFERHAPWPATILRIMAVHALMHALIHSLVLAEGFVPIPWQVFLVVMLAAGAGLQKVILGLSAKDTLFLTVTSLLMIALLGIGLNTVLYAVF